MSMKDRAENAAQDLKGKAQEAWGKVTGDDETRLKGEANQAAADVKNGVEDVKDAFKD
ncbi:MAG: CsbD family protein [Microbacterium sp.]